jgi:hypothetical protein
MQSPMLHTGTSKVDPLILRILPLKDRQQSSYTLYEDSSVDESSTSPERCVFSDLTHIRLGQP